MHTRQARTHLKIKGSNVRVSFIALALFLARFVSLLKVKGWYVNMFITMFKSTTGPSWSCPHQVDNISSSWNRKHAVTTCFRVVSHLPVRNDSEWGLVLVHNLNILIFIWSSCGPRCRPRYQFRQYHAVLNPIYTDAVLSLLVEQRLKSLRCSDRNNNQFISYNY